ncbi:MAG: hypothetical protein FWF83_02435 [Clostridiales bacterium]|nr:hypothetical protein [Clostridiales bacterium]
MRFVLVAVYIIVSVSGLFMMKLGGEMHFGLLNNRLAIDVGLQNVLGILLYGVSFILYLAILPKFDLSYIFPLCTGIVYVLIVVFSRLVLKEAISAVQMAGIVLVLVGIVIMNFKAK